MSDNRPITEIVALCDSYTMLEAQNERLRADMLEAENEVLRAENSRLNAALVRISAIRRSVSVAADSVNYALEIADKALAEKPAPEIEHD